MSHQRIAAFFDLDLTLLSINSGRLWIKRERRAGRVSLLQLVQASFFFAAYKFQAVDIDRVTKKALETVKGLDEATLREWTHRWFFDEVIAHTAPGAWPVLEQHRQAGHALVLLTASSPYEAEAAAQHFALDGYLSSVYECKGGLLTGEIVQPLCYGKGKVHHAQNYAQQHNIDVDNSFFYTDSFSDLPMLQRVANPRVVHPDPRLHRHARRMGWPVYDWRQAPQQAVTER